jgi:predicted transcriptional regulator
MDDPKTLAQIVEKVSQSKHDSRKIVRSLEDTGMLYRRGSTRPVYITTELGQKMMPTYQSQ